jgi:hypothetical protein
MMYVMPDWEGDPDFSFQHSGVDHEAQLQAAAFVAGFTQGFETVIPQGGFAIVDAGARQPDYISCLLAVMVETARSLKTSAVSFEESLAALLAKARGMGIVDEQSGIALHEQHAITQLATDIGLQSEFVTIYPHHTKGDELIALGEKIAHYLNQGSGIALSLGKAGHYVLLHRDAMGRVMAYDFLGGVETERSIGSIAQNVGYIHQGGMSGPAAIRTDILVLRAHKVIDADPVRAAVERERDWLKQQMAVKIPAEYSSPSEWLVANRAAVEKRLGLNAEQTGGENWSKLGKAVKQVFLVQPI